MVSITYERGWDGPILPLIFCRMILEGRLTRDTEVLFLRSPNGTVPQTILIENPGLRPKILMAMPAGAWNSRIAAHEFAHVLQLLEGRHAYETPEKLEEEANAFEECYGVDWKDPTEICSPACG